MLAQLAAPEIAVDAPASTLKSPKSRLQEHTQKTTGGRPSYVLLDAVGPDHEKRFRIDVTVGGKVLGRGEGLSRREAETAAAAQALESITTVRPAERGSRVRKGGGPPA